MRYAQIDETGICVVVSRLSGTVTAGNMIAIADDINPLGQRWNGSEFEAVEVVAIDIPLSRIEFMDRFTDPEMVAIYTAAASQPMVNVWVKKLEATAEISLTSHRTIDGLNALEAAGLIAEGRAAEILTA